MSYASVWLIVIGTAGVATIGVYLLVRQLTSGFLRALVCALILALLLTPAPVPEHPVNFAPAFIVAIFEGLLQSDGSPWVALRLLLVGLTVALAAVTLGALALRRWAGRLPEE